VPNLTVSELTELHDDPRRCADVAGIWASNAKASSALQRRSPIDDAFGPA